MLNAAGDRLDVDLLDQRRYHLLIPRNLRLHQEASRQQKGDQEQKNNSKG